MPSAKPDMKTKKTPARKPDKQQKTERIYENVCYERDNVTLIEVPYRTDESKLRIVIENFDKILSEFSKGPPKLVKSKTCSIIESKCILKKSLSNPMHLDARSNLETGLTKSLSDMNFDLQIPEFYLSGKKVVKTDTFTKPKPKIGQRVAPRGGKPVDGAKKGAGERSTKTITRQVAKSPQKPSKLPKTPLEKSKSSPKLTEDPPNPFPVKLRKVNPPEIKPKLSEPPKTWSKPSDLRSKHHEVVSKHFGSAKVLEARKSPDPPKPPRAILSKAKSSWDISTKRPSKIPVKSALGKNLSPSIPNDLNKLDRPAIVRPKPPKDTPEDHVSVKTVVAKLESASKSPETDDLAKNRHEKIQNLKIDMKSARKLIETIEKHDSDLDEFEKLERKFKIEDKAKDYSSDCSDDSGNISNDHDLDCDVEEEILTPESPKVPPSTAGNIVRKEIAKIEAEKPKYKSEIFFRANVLGQLESRRDEKLTGRVVSLQAHCRGYLARKKLQQRRLQDLAVRCIQRNVRKFMSVRDWPWWRLLVRVTPLLNVHRTEEELRVKTEELETLRAKLEKLELERTNLKHDNDKLEAKPLNMPLISTRQPAPLLSQKNGLPPVHPLGINARRLTAIKRSHTTQIDTISESDVKENFSPRPRTVFQQRPLRNLQVISQGHDVERKVQSLRNDLNGNINGLEQKVVSLKNTLRQQNDMARPKFLPQRLPKPATNDYLTQKVLSAHRMNGHQSRSSSMPRSISSLSMASVSRSVSPCSTYSIRSSSVRSAKSPTPRRIFPQISPSFDLSDLEDKDQSPVVFDAGLTFVIGTPQTSVSQKMTVTPAHLDDTTASNALSAKISDFLQRTDHVMDEWRNMGHKDERDDNTWTGYHNVRRNAEERRVLGRSRSATNIMIKGFQYFSRASSVSRSNSVVRDFSDDRMTDFDQMTDLDELSEMTADLAEEHSTSTLATERLDAETQERIRLEKELTDLQSKNRSLQQSSERLEMELLYARSDLNGMNSEEDEDGEADGGVYKQRYERVARELEFTRRRLQQQHEDDLEQLVGLKKQLEKKLADAYEEVEEQRQVVGQWKRKVQKLNAETNDLRLLLEEQNARNNLLEKKQRKFDSEAQLLHDELRQEKATKERFAREKEVVLAEKYTMENNLADVRLELDLKEEKIHSLQRELDELTYGGKTEEEVTLLRKQKLECERRLHEQEEELDELAGQNQLLEQAKLRLEMSLEQIRKESKREAQQRDEELEEARCNAQKKVKALESQLENEHEERTLLLREKHELDRRLVSLSELQRGDRAAEEAQLQRLRRDLKRTKALLRDAQTMIEKYRADGSSRAVLRQLRNQLEDAECARSNAVKAKQVIEGELSEVQAQLEEAQRQRSEADDRFNSANRERTELRTQLEENEEELAEVLKKYRSAVQQSSVDQLTLQEQVSLVSELESERNLLRERLAELTTKLETMESLGDPSSNLLAKRMELRCKELESKLELEQTTRSRLEVQIARLKETVEKLQTELATSRTKEQFAQDQIRKLQRSMRELRDEYVATSARESESLQKRKELEKKVEACEAETSAAKADLKLAMKRIDDLQSAIQGELEDTMSDHSESEQDSYSSDESIESFLANHKLGPSKSRSPLKDVSPA